MLDYLIVLFCLVILCLFWAIFQIWLRKQDVYIAFLKSSCLGCSRKHCQQNNNKK